ncbi:MAG: RiPP maturation radical SAM C-methyltransferase [Desulfobulbales bacterium]|nr:RiPP maturation radical SAM C-methyltransferase [Desulfobulbales bacterium]
MNSPKRTAQTGPEKIKLISMPWALFNRPSIQLGILKAYLESRKKKLSVETSHPYLEVAAILGPDLYHWISQNPWVSEALYAPLVFPEQTAAAEELAMQYVRKADANIKRSFHFAPLLEKLGKQLSQWIDADDWPQYTLVGFSLCFHQLCASLAAARAIKDKHPDATIVFGGSACGAGAGGSLLESFQVIDYVIEGEGETGLLTLCRYLGGQHPNPLPVNIVSRKNGKAVKQQRTKLHGAGTQLPTLADLPVPDYSVYFSDKKKWFAHTPFIPVIPVEFSRGCWWNKCSFCNLNLQWCGYRQKNAAHMLHEVKTLAKRHGCLDFTFTDNMLPPGEARKFFNMTGQDSSDYAFFAEIRSPKGREPLADLLAIYRRGGLATIQVGIEALSSSLLHKMQKGISVIENIAAMRSAQENTLALEGNLIVHFPGSTEAEAAETMENLDYVFPYRPLAAASFFLGFDSPVYRDPQKYGIRAIVNHANNYKLFPKEVLKSINLLVQDYKGDRVHQRNIWKPVLRKIKEWQQYHEQRKKNILAKPLLYYRDGYDFLLIHQELSDGKVLHHRLHGTSRQIYLFCTDIRTDKEIFQEFASVADEKILAFLAGLQQKRLLFSEKNRYLSLAVHCKY